MNKVLAAAAVLAALSLSGPAAAAEPANPQSFAVLGLRAPGGPSVAELVSQFRKALTQQTAGVATVQTEAEAKANLSLPSAQPAAAIKTIGDAEGDYQRYQLELARAKFEAGLQELVGLGGEEGIWESTVNARVLLGMVHLALNGKDPLASKKAQSEFEAILRVYPNFQALSRIDDPVVLALFEKARAKVNREPAGELVVSCSSPCPAGFVWANQAPRGKVNGPAIKLPVGTYRVRVTDGQDAPHLFSFNHEVQIQDGGKAALLVDLESEGALDFAGGPAFAVASEPERRLKVLQLVGHRVQRGKVAAVWLDEQYVHLAVSDAASGNVERHAAVAAPKDGKFDEACLELARFAAGGQPPPAAVVSLAAALDARPQPPPTPSGARPLAIAKWTVLGVTAAAGIVGGIVAASAESDRKNLVNQYGQGAPANYRDEATSLSNKQHLRNGILIGAGVGVAATAVLFIVDALGPGDSAAKATDEAAPAAKPAAVSFEVRPDGFALAF